MGKDKKPKGVASNISSSTNPAASSTTHTSTRSSILRSSFSPSALQLSLFASVIQGFDSQHLRIHDTVTGRLRCEHAIPSRASITCLDWGYCGGVYEDRHSDGSKKKRKRSELANGDGSSTKAGDAAVAFGTSDSEVHIFSPAESKVLKVLGGAHTNGVRDFRFKEHGLHAEGWSVGGDAKLVQWDLRKARAIRTVTLPHGPANALRPLKSSVICASQNAYILDPSSQEKPPVFAASTNTIHSIVDSSLKSSKASKFLTAAETDRYLNVFSADSPTLIGSLRTESEVLSVDFIANTDLSNRTESLEDNLLQILRPQEVLLVVNRDGALEIFPEPFDFGEGTKEELKSMKARIQKRSRPRNAVVRLRRPDKSSSIVPFVNASFQGEFIVMAWVEGGINPLFERIQWREGGSGNMLLKDVTEVLKTKSGPGLEAEVMNGVKYMGKSQVDESHAVVVNGADAVDVSMAGGPTEVIEISSGEESDSEDEVPVGLLGDSETSAKADGEVRDEDVDMEEAEPQERADQDVTGGHEEPEEAEEPSFGDLIRANASEAVDVQASFVDPIAQSLVPGGDRSLQQLPSGMSLGTVLTQSLRTNDTNLLETCFHVRDLSMVRATIERLDSSFATILLQRLAERLHSRPGRAGSLMVWIQWTLVAHGGYLAGQPEIMKKLASLHRVVKDRANSLQSLLSLKGKLDMLEAQMNLRKSMQARSRAANTLDEDDEEGVIYVEGQEESDSEEEEGEEAVASKLRPSTGAERSQEVAVEDDSESVTSEAESGIDSEHSEDEMPTTNGAIAESEDEGSDSDEEGLFDEEASSTDNDSVDEASEDEVDHESVDSVDSSDADASPPPKRPAKSKLSNGVSPRKR